MTPPKNVASYLDATVTNRVIYPFVANQSTSKCLKTLPHLSVGKISRISQKLAYLIEFFSRPWKQPILTHENESSRNYNQWLMINRCSMQDITSHHEVRTWNHHIISSGNGGTHKNGTHGSPKNRHGGKGVHHGNHEKPLKRPSKFLS